LRDCFGLDEGLLFFTKGQPTQKIWYYDLTDNKVGKKTPWRSSISKTSSACYPHARTVSFPEPWTWLAGLPLRLDACPLVALDRQQHDRLFVIYPGSLAYPLADKVTALPLASLVSPSAFDLLDSMVMYACSQM
jgi:hypothetical protein